MALESITQVRGKGVYILGHDIDTDRIIPARYLRCVTFDGLGEALFYDVRFFEDGTPKKHPLNDPRFAGATIMISGSNFGCGSSREHAPQSIYRAGFKAVIAESFAEIFHGNSTTLGMPCVEATSEQIRTIVAAIETNPDTEIVIDVANETVTTGSEIHQVSIRRSAKDVLVNGRWDPIGDLLGSVPRVLFLVAFFFVVFSSIVGGYNGLSYLMADAIRVARGIPDEDADRHMAITSPVFRAFVCYCVVASTVIVFAGRPVGLVMIYAIFGSLILPILAAALLWLLNRRSVEPIYRNGILSNIGLAGALALFGLLGIAQILESF
jgi:3-isopropylmalate/(R)-2-methylmalate dehydratase small subunit